MSLQDGNDTWTVNYQKGLKALGELGSQGKSQYLNNAMNAI